MGPSVRYREGSLSGPALPSGQQEPPLVCVASGPGRAAEYLGDLGGPRRTFILLDTRGTGASEMPAGLGSCRVDRIVADVEAYLSGGVPGHEQLQRRSPRPNNTGPR